MAVGMLERRAEGILGDEVGEFFRMDLGEAVVTLLPRYGMVAMKSLLVGSVHVGCIGSGRVSTCGFI
jgi:hypothetical protein